MTRRAFFEMARQVVRYGTVGLLNNLLGYFIYLVVTWLWLDPKVAVTFMYPIGAVTAYFGHAKYAFTYNGRPSLGVIRYAIAHLIGYGVNMGMLSFFSDRLGYAHQWVQATAIVVVAGILYLLLRYFVFPNRSLPS